MLHASWLKSNIYPLRDDIKPNNVLEALHEFANMGMIDLYRVGKREYFQICQWAEYQGNTIKEAPSPYPGVEEGFLIDSSGVSQELLRTNSGVSKTNVGKYPSISESISTSTSKKASKKNKEPAPVIIPDCLNTPAFTAAWDDFTEHRKEIKSAMTPRAANMQLKTLSAYTPDVAIKMLERSIANGWKGVFPLNQNGNSQRKPQHETKHLAGSM